MEYLRTKFINFNIWINPTIGGQPAGAHAAPRRPRHRRPERRHRRDAGSGLDVVRTVRRARPPSHGNERRRRVPCLGTPRRRRVHRPVQQHLRAGPRRLAACRPPADPDLIGVPKGSGRLRIQAGSCTRHDAETSVRGCVDGFHSSAFPGVVAIGDADPGPAARRCPGGRGRPRGPGRFAPPRWATLPGRAGAASSPSRRPTPGGPEPCRHRGRGPPTPGRGPRRSATPAGTTAPRRRRADGP